MMHGKKLTLVCILTCYWMHIGAASYAADAEAPRVRIDAGIVEGTLEDESRVFRGIPYVAPPVGELRWRAPQPAAAWTGIRAAKKYGPICPQMRPGRFQESEDCLTLNVWSPVKAEKLPVMLWIHGGANVNGNGNMDGSSFTRDGIVFVSLNYRLGRFGVFAHPDLTREATKRKEPTGNFGVLDQIAALRWIQRNITAFGGDPARVTIFGVSAGGSHVNNLMASPMASGLFHGAISQSGANGLMPSRQMAVAERAGLRVAKSRNVSGVAGLRDLRWQDLVDRDARYRSESSAIIDGQLLPDAVNEVFRKGQQNSVPYIAGATSFEGSLSRAIPIPLLERGIAQRAEEITEIYGREITDPILPLLVYGDFLFVAPTRYLVAEMGNVDADARMYHMDYVREDMRGKMHGARHGGEVAFVFDRLREIKVNKRISRMLGVPEGVYRPSEKDQNIATILHSYWVKFAKTGNPNAKGLPEWPTYTGTDDRTLLIANDGITVRRGLRKQILDRIESYYKEQPGAAQPSE